MTFSHFSHFILYHIPQSVYTFYSFVDSFDYYTAFWFPLKGTSR